MYVIPEAVLVSKDSNMVISLLHSPLSTEVWWGYQPDGFECGQLCWPK